MLSNTRCKLGSYRGTIWGLIMVIFTLTNPELLLAKTTEIVGKVVKVTDADTIRVLSSDNTEIRVRLAEIDAPERGQPWSKKATQALRDKIGGQQVRVVVKDIDHYGRTVGHVYLKSELVNDWLVEQGHAWVYAKYNKRQELHSLQEAAQREQRGLWKLPEAQKTPPWDWRKQH